MTGHCLFYGCWNEPGHFLVAAGGARSGLPLQEEYALIRGSLDGGFAPRKGRSGEICWHAQIRTPDEDRALDWELRDSNEYPQGQFLRHRHGKWSLLQWWDRCQGDKRDASNSTVLLEGDHTTEEMLAALARHFPHVLENLEKAGVKLIEVTP